MEKTFIEDQEFQGVDFNAQPLKIGNYEHCIFRNCDLSNGDLSEMIFVDCEFFDCDLSMVRVDKTAFRNASFQSCKLLGIRFDDANDLLLSIRFEECHLSFSSFYKKPLPSTTFRNCLLREVDFTEADLSEAVFEHCDLSGAVFEHTNLESADFRTSGNYRLDPEKNRIRKARFSLDGAIGLLHKYEIVIE